MRAPRPGPRAREGRGWRRWFLLLIGLALLVLAPVLAHAQESDSVLVVWTAPGDDGSSGTAAEFDLRWSLSPINSGNFDSQNRVEGLPAPGPSGTRHQVIVRGLSRGTTYYFAIRTVDDAGNWSELSNLAQWDWNLDATAPAAPQGLTAEFDGNDARLAWTANSEPDLRGYTVYRAIRSSGPYTALNSTPLTTPEYLDTQVPRGVQAVWYQVTASDINGNESPRSSPYSLVIVSPAAKAVPGLQEGFPNPSRGSEAVTMRVTNTGGGTDGAVVDILDAGGQLVRRMEISLGVGTQDVVWDGKNNYGRQVAPGAYRAVLIAGDQRSSIRLLRVP